MTCLTTHFDTSHLAEEVGYSILFWFEDLTVLFSSVWICLNVTASRVSSTSSLPSITVTFMLRCSVFHVSYSHNVICVSVQIGLKQLASCCFVYPLLTCLHLLTFHIRYSEQSVSSNLGVPLSFFPSILPSNTVWINPCASNYTP